MAGLKGMQALKMWAKTKVDGYKDVRITDMSKSFRDGLAFCAIIHRYRPDLIDFDSLSKENIYENNELAFDVAQNELGIPSLLDAEDMVAMEIPDKLSIMTYLAQYYNYFKDQVPVGGPGIKTPVKRHATPGSPKQDYKKAKEKYTPSSEKKVGTLSDRCKICDKKVYLLERHIVDGKSYHRSCYRDTHASPAKKPYHSVLLSPVNKHSEDTPKTKRVVNHKDAWSEPPKSAVSRARDDFFEPKNRQNNKEDAEAEIKSAKLKSGKDEPFSFKAGLEGIEKGKRHLLKDRLKAALAKHDGDSQSDKTDNSETKSKLSGSKHVEDREIKMEVETTKSAHIDLSDDMDLDSMVESNTGAIVAKKSPKGKGRPLSFKHKGKQKLALKTHKHDDTVGSRLASAGEDLEIPVERKSSSGTSDTISGNLEVTPSLKETKKNEQPVPEKQPCSPTLNLFVQNFSRETSSKRSDKAKSAIFEHTGPKESYPVSVRHSYTGALQSKTEEISSANQDSSSSTSGSEISKRQNKANVANSDARIPKTDLLNSNDVQTVHEKSLPKTDKIRSSSMDNVADVPGTGQIVKSSSSDHLGNHCNHCSERVFRFEKTEKDGKLYHKKCVDKVPSKQTGAEAVAERINETKNREPVGKLDDKDVFKKPLVPVGRQPRESEVKSAGEMSPRPRSKSADMIEQDLKKKSEAQRPRIVSEYSPKVTPKFVRSSSEDKILGILKKHNAHETSESDSESSKPKELPRSKTDDTITSKQNKPQWQVNVEKRAEARKVPGRSVLDEKEKREKLDSRIKSYTADNTSTHSNIAPSKVAAVTERASWQIEAERRKGKFVDPEKRNALEKKNIGKVPEKVDNTVKKTSVLEDKKIQEQNKLKSENRTNDVWKSGNRTNNVKNKTVEKSPNDYPVTLNPFEEDIEEEKVKVKVETKAPVTPLLKNTQPKLEPVTTPAVQDNWEDALENWASSRKTRITKQPIKSYNPFDEEEDENDENVSNNNTNAKKKVSTNPFGSESEEEEVESFKTRNQANRPVSSTPSQSNNRPVVKKITVDTRFRFDSSEDGDGDVFHKGRDHGRYIKKRPAPKPPADVPTSSSFSQRNTSGEESTPSPRSPRAGRYHKKPAPQRPSPVKRMIRSGERRMSTEEMSAELEDLDQKQTMLEIKGRKLENKIRSSADTADEDDDQLLKEWFELVNEKNKMVRRESEIMYLGTTTEEEESDTEEEGEEEKDGGSKSDTDDDDVFYDAEDDCDDDEDEDDNDEDNISNSRQQQLEERQADIEFELRCLMEKPAYLKTKEDKGKEEDLLAELIDVVEERNKIVNSMDEDRIRFEEEDQEIEAVIGKGIHLDEGKSPGGKKKEKKDKKGKKARKEKKKST